VLLELASKAQELISCLIWINWHPWGVDSLLIVVILDGSLYRIQFNEERETLSLGKLF
jgi:hypothetical protein